MHNICNADIRFNYLKRPYSVTMGTFQMAVLLSFNKGLSLTIKELHETTQLPEKELIKQVQSLIEAKILSVTASSATADAAKTSVNLAIYTDHLFNFFVGVF